MLSVMLFLASRDPARNVAIIDAFTVGLCVLAVTPLISFYMLDIQRIYPGHLVWGRSLIRLGLAAVLLFLRRCDLMPTLRAECGERRIHFFEIDLPASGHSGIPQRSEAGVR
jgi:hypothetical protein